MCVEAVHQHEEEQYDLQTSLSDHQKNQGKFVLNLSLSGNFGEADIRIFFKAGMSCMGQEDDIIKCRCRRKAGDHLPVN